MCEVDRAGRNEAEWRRERPDLDPSSIGVVTRIWHLAKIFGDDRRRLLGRHGIDPALLDLLGTLRRSGKPYELTTRELASRCLVTPAAISQRLARAEGKGWVTRHAVDRRGVLVRLTENGREVMDQIAGEIFDRELSLLAGLDEGDRRQLAALLERLVLDLGEPGPIPSVGG